MHDADRPAFYAAQPGQSRWADWWTLLHPPYTAWHVSYVVIGACLAPHLHAGVLVAMVAAFAAAVGVSAHALDELHGRPLRTAIPDRTLVAATVAGLVVACALGIYGVAEVGVVLVPFIVIGPLLVVGYNLELFGGRLHTDLGFALAWGAFPVLTGFVAQTGRMEVSAVVAAIAAVGFSLAQRTLSTPARRMRRRVASVEGTITTRDGGTEPIDRSTLLAPIERTLRILSWSMVALALALLVARSLPI